jgi:hypothetical protein
MNASAELESLVRESPRLMSLLGAIHDPKTGQPITFMLKPGQKTYRYFQLGQTMHCYSPHPDLNGRYWYWSYVPFGTGARLGTAKQWKLVHPVSCATRGLAKRRALSRYNAERHKAISAAVKAAS